MPNLTRVASVTLLLVSPLAAQGPIPGLDPNSRPPVAGEATSDTVAAPQANVALPNAAATTMGNSNNIIGVGSPNMRYQQIHDGASVGPARPFFGHAYRMRNATYTGGVQTIEIRVATTSVAPASITTNLTTNITGPQTTVFKGTYNLPNMVPNTDPTKWAILYPWTQPWPWSPAAGQHFAYEHLNSSTNSISYYADAFSGNPSVSRAWGTGVTATTGSIGTGFGLAMCLFTTPIPPIGTFDKFGTGCPGTGGKTGVIVPASMRTAIGNSNNIFGTAYFNQRYHQIFDGSEVGARRVFTGHAFRAGTGSYAAIAVANAEILMASTKNAPGAISTSFASNLNGTIQQLSVFKGTLNYPAMVPSTNPTEFKIPVPWSQPFVWLAPAGEHLLYEYTNTGTASYGSYFPNAHSGDPNTARLYATPANAVTGTTGTSFGVVFCFQYNGIGNAVPSMGNRGTPVTGKSFDVLVADAQSKPGVGVLVLGFSDAMWGTIPLPLKLDGLGAKGCSLLVSADLLAPTLIDGTGGGALTVPIPNDAALLRLALFFQWAVLDAGANALGWAFSDGGKAVIGGL